MNTIVRESVESGSRPGDLRIAAVGDLHFDGSIPKIEELQVVLHEAARTADILLLCGDLTTHGQPGEIAAFVRELQSFEGHVIAVLGNHDHESDCAPMLEDMLSESGVHVLEGAAVTLGNVGFAGVKGFGGGFGKGRIEPFGERALKTFVEIAIEEADRLDAALATLETPVKVVLTHYAPIVETLHGEPEYLWPFLGSSRLMHTIDKHGAAVAFHGHAHYGSPSGRTAAGIPIHNVSLPVLRTALKQHLRIWTPGRAVASSSTRLAQEA
ncbi:MAG: metallophosphoesterase [Vicinamibacterales bacterium]